MYDFVKINTEINMGDFANYTSEREREREREREFSLGFKNVFLNSLFKYLESIEV